MHPIMISPTDTMQSAPREQVTSPDMENPTIPEEYELGEAMLQEGRTPRTQHDTDDDEEFGEEHKPSWLAWVGLAALCAASVAMLSTSLGIKKAVVVHIENIPRFTQLKGSIIAIVGTIVHILIGSLVIRASALTLLWMMTLFKGVRFSLLYDVIAGAGWSRLMHCVKNRNYFDMFVWILLGFGSAAAAIISGSIFKDTTCVTSMSISLLLAASGRWKLFEQFGDSRSRGRYYGNGKHCQQARLARNYL